MKYYDMSLVYYSGFERYNFNINFKVGDIWDCRSCCREDVECLYFLGNRLFEERGLLGHVYRREEVEYVNG